MVSKPWLSILLPTYLGETFLPEALESIVAQDCEGLEVVAVDDGSTDSTLDILDDFSRQLDLTVLALEHEGNWVRNTNRALHRARGVFVSVLHQDDCWKPHRAQRLRELVEERPQASFVLHPVDLIDHTRRRLGTIGPPIEKRDAAVVDGKALWSSLLVQNTIMMPGPAFRREVALAVGGFDEALWYTADWQMWLDLSRRGEVLFLPAPLAEFRVHGGSLTVRGRERADEMRRQQSQVLSRALEREDTVVPASRQRAARLSIEVNFALAEASHGSLTPILRLMPRALRAGPGALVCYLRDSRIWTRSRVRLGPLLGFPGRT